MRRFASFVALLLAPFSAAFGAECGDDPAAVKALKAIHAELKFDKDGSIIYVDISERDDVDDNVMRHLSGLPKLKRFHAIFTKITGSGLKHLTKAKHLEVLDLCACPITDDGLRHVRNLTQLRKVNLGGSKVTDKSIQLLANWKKLKYLAVGGSQITREGIRKLQAALPDCEVE